MFSVIAQVIQLANAAPGWASYLPPTYQLSGAYWVFAICLFMRMILTSLPDNLRIPVVLQGITMIVGIVASLFIFPASVARVYAVGTGIIGSGGTIQFYDIFLSVIEKKIRGYLGITSPTP